MGSDLCRPADKALRCPLGPFLVGFGHVFFNCAVPGFVMAADVAGHPFTLVEAFNGGVCDAHIDSFFF